MKDLYKFLRGMQHVPFEELYKIIQKIQKIFFFCMREVS